jgi:Protein of unknown function (DUF1569)
MTDTKPERHGQNMPENGAFASINGLELYFEMQDTGDPLVALKSGFGSGEKGVFPFEQFVRGGKAGITRQQHPFFGHLTPLEWSRLQFVHLDHHFKQFGV